jgi:hypothetical protein
MATALTSATWQQRTTLAGHRIEGAEPVRLRLRARHDRSPDIRMGTPPAGVARPAGARTELRVRSAADRLDYGAPAYRPQTHPTGQDLPTMVNPRLLAPQEIRASSARRSRCQKLPVDLEAVNLRV